MKFYKRGYPRSALCPMRPFYRRKGVDIVAVRDLTAEEFDAAIAGGTTLVDFWATWCGPCRMQSPVVDEFAEKHPEVQVCKVNVDDQRELALRYGVMSIPTLLVFRNGKPIAQQVGLAPMEKLEEMTK